MTYNKLSRYAPYVLRMSIGFVFMWFGWSGITNVDMWTGLVPTWATHIASAEMLVLLHGWFELICGILLFSGFLVRIVSGLLFLNLLHIIFLLEPGAVMIRDIGIVGTLLAIFLAGGDNSMTASTVLNT